MDAPSFDAADAAVCCRSAAKEAAELIRVARKSDPGAGVEESPQATALTARSICGSRSGAQEAAEVIREARKSDPGRGIEALLEAAGGGRRSRCGSSPALQPCSPPSLPPLLLGAASPTDADDEDDSKLLGSLYAGLSRLVSADAEWALDDGVLSARGPRVPPVPEAEPEEGWRLGRQWVVTAAPVVVYIDSNECTPYFHRRLEIGSVVRELRHSGGRFEYELLAGSGPMTGWIAPRPQGGDEGVLLVRPSSEACGR